MVYGVCNLPMVIRLFYYTYTLHTAGLYVEWSDFYQFDRPYNYFHNFTFTLLIAANSAVNPLLYFWRMCRLRECVLSGVKRMCNVFCGKLPWGTPHLGQQLTEINRTRVVGEFTTSAVSVAPMRTLWIGNAQVHPTR